MHTRARGAACAECGEAGVPVEWATLAAFTTVSLPPRQDFWLCRTEDCDTLYFGSKGQRIDLTGARVRPGFKRGGDLLCYCFLVRRSGLAQMDAAEREATLESIVDRVRATACACDVRNPSGRCCLRTVRQAIRELDGG